MNLLQEIVQYRSEDGVVMKTGDAAYDYYCMKPGEIGRDLGRGWFDFEHSDGTVEMLNGQRICSLEHARRMRWPGA